MKIADHILEVVADLKGKPQGAHNIRLNGKTSSRQSTKNIEIVNKTDNPGIDIIIKPGTVSEFVHIPVVIDTGGITEMVYNDFYIGENSDVVIVAGCGIHNDGSHLTQHDGIHTFYVGKNSKVKYVEKHYGEGGGTGENVLNPITVIHLDEGSSMEMESVQINGVDSTRRVTKADLADNASLVTKEIIMTSGTQLATTDFQIELNGKGSSTNIVSRSVAKGKSSQVFTSIINGNNECIGHSECDAIIMDEATVKAVPDVTAKHVDAMLIHEAAIGKIAGDQINKLMTLGMSEEEAEEEIVSGFLR
ncbi:SufB/SufD family protein [Microaceticoccus formicicus]|uniref:SufB/SufD family protein n=1 Tax=Microaceticoccus formicicus TaxID=3118105 RepID=UPI003CD01112|nr:SufD family Fe-S cluster assembly protein [Peptoniphilaceae bacterium AMB_02]